MSGRALFKNAFQQIKRTWAKTDEIDFRLASFDRRILDLEDVAHTPSEAECKRQETGTPMPSGLTKWSLGDIVHELVAIGAGYSSYDQADMASELVRRMTEAVSDTGIVFGVDEKGNGVAGGTFQPAPVPAASEPLTTGMTFYPDGTVTVKEAAAPSTSEQLWVFNPNWRESNFAYYPATLAQLRQAAVAMGLLDAERQRTAEAFLHAAKFSPGSRNDETSYADLVEYLRIAAKEGHSWTFRFMATSLESAVKEEAAVLSRTTEGER